MRETRAADWSDRLEGFTIKAFTSDDGSMLTVLEGLISDQTALSGILNTLYSLHYPVVSVDCLGPAGQ